MESYNLYLYHKRMEKGLKTKEFSKFLGINRVTYYCIEMVILNLPKKEIKKYQTN